MMPEVIGRRGARTGYTLIEIVIVIGITLVLAGITLSYTATTKQYVSISVETAHVAQYLARAKSEALASYAQAGAACGYGIFIANATDMERFAYNDATNCSSTGMSVASITNAANRTLLETSKIGSGITLDTSNGVVQAVVFVPPDPTTYYVVRGSGALNPGANGIIRLLGSSASADVRITGAGQITF
jgi:Tfp pilus assembly major pilin PilA